LMAAEDLSPASITRRLKTRFIGQKVLYFPRLASTMDVARREALRGAAGGTVIMAGEQTAGRGRLKRRWLSPPGNIALSVILYPDVSSLPYLIMIASLAVVRSIEVVTGLKARIKWPNDVLIAGRKVAGILIENEVRGNRVACAVIGIGINVNIKPSNLDAASVLATSLGDELDKNVSPADVVRQLLVEMERLYLALPDGEDVYQEWRDRLDTLGKRVCVISGGTRLEGIAESVDRSGALILRQDDGSLASIIAGDVTLRDV
jgi:BirA family biotin operon repressor/biotin-[acetyl-CoA-carboxylase] ligase